MTSKTIFAFILGACSIGCVSMAPPREFNPAELDGDARWVAVRDVPLVRQYGDDDGGAAAMAMLLSYWHVAATPREVEAACATSSGSAEAARLREFARSKGLRAYTFIGDFDDLRRELARSRPVLVGVAKPGEGATPATHFAVVVAVHPENRIVVTLDPVSGWQQTDFDEFLAEWEPVGKTAMVVFTFDSEASPAVHARS